MAQPGGREPAPGSLALVQDLANTFDLEEGSDSLRGPEEFRSFWTAHGADAADLAGLTQHEVDACRELREGLRAACRAHAGTDLPAPSVLDELLRMGPLTVTVDRTGDVRLRPAPGLIGLPLVTATVAAAVAAAATDGTWKRLKACAVDSCQWVYYDRSPAGRSRWCTMAVCGSRTKMRAYRARTV